MSKQTLIQTYHRLLNWEINIATKVIIVVMVLFFCLSIVGSVITIYSHKHSLIKSYQEGIDAFSFRIQQVLVESNYKINSTTESHLEEIAVNSIFPYIEIYMGSETYVFGENKKDLQKQFSRKIHGINSISDTKQLILVRAYVKNIGSSLKQKLIEYIIVSSILLVLIGSITAWIINQIVSKPIKLLVNKTRLITTNNAIARLDVKRKDEYGELSDFINKMLDNLDKQQQELKHALSEAKKANTAKSVFLANMSHEIRTPLTAIIGFEETLHDEERSKDEHLSSIQTIKDNGNLLLQIINDILDLSKIEAEKFVIEHVPFSLFGFIEEIKAITKQRAIEKGIQFAINYHFPIPENLNTDPLRLKKILLNLCSNAIKFTNQGHIHINIRYDIFQDNICFEVFDTGIGLTEDQLTRIFNAFDQADSSTTRRYGGTGLGLSLSKKLANLLDGDIQVNSKIGSGSQFSVSVKTGITNNLTLLYAAPNTPKHIPPVKSFESIPKVKGSILLAEDIPDNQQLMEFFIKKTQAELTIVENGKQAVQSALDNNFDLILMDMQMPVMDGLHAVEELRRKNYQGIIAMVTANTMKEDRIKSLRAGCNDFLPKPINQKELYKLIQRYLSADLETRDEPEPLYSNITDEPEIVELVKKFVLRLPESIRLVNEKYASQEFDELGKVTHKIKGQGGQFGYPELSKIAKVVEMHIKDGNLQALADSIEEINSISSRIYAGTSKINNSEHTSKNHDLERI